MNWWENDFKIDDPLAIYQHSDEWHENRRSTLRASDATILARGKPEDICRLWRVKTGRQKRSKKQPSLAQILGMVTEDANARYFEATTGRAVWGRNTDHVHTEHGWLGLSADGITTSESGQEAYLELKCVACSKDLPRLYDQHQRDYKRLITYRAWEREIVYPLLVQEYYAQCQHACFVGGWDVAVLCAIIGNQQVAGEVEFDPEYHEELFQIEQMFWYYVQEDRKPDETLFRGVQLPMHEEEYC